MTINTDQTDVAIAWPEATVQSFELTIQQPGQPARTWSSKNQNSSIGSHPSNDLIIDAPQVSRFHCELKLQPRGLLLKDLGSSNGTVLNGVNVIEAWVSSGSRLGLGTATIEVRLNGVETRLPTSANDSFGSLVGSSQLMRGLFAQLERAAPSNITVLLEGETGTGKEQAAAAIHAASPRRDEPFVVIDCGMLPSNLLESELFGHERGAYTGAQSGRAGAFESAKKGTVFLDEIGELPIELQPKLLRVLEAKEYRRLGSSTVRHTDVRVIAATNRDLRREINEGHFRADLYFRLAVMRVTMPPLRAHPEDLPELARRVLAALGATASEISAICTPSLLASLRAGAWAGNVRELRNHLERCLLFVTGLPLEEPQPPPAPPVVDVSKSLVVERRRHVDAFEREYVRALLAVHDGKVNAAAAAAGVDRAHLYRLIKRLGLTTSEKGES